MENVKGQHTIEYLILIGAIIGVILVLMGQGGSLRSRINQTYDLATNSMVGEAAQVKTTVIGP